MEDLTPAMKQAVELARRNGAVFAGFGNEISRGSCTTVAASTIAALVRRGILTKRISPDGGMMGVLTQKEEGPLMSTQKKTRMVAFIPVEGYVEGHGYRVSLVVEGEDGHRPTGTWPYEGKVGQQAPWFWGHNYEEARKEARDYNAKMGIDEQTAFDIVTRSMTQGDI